MKCDKGESNSSTFSYHVLPADTQKKLKCSVFGRNYEVVCNEPIEGLQTWEPRATVMGERYYRWAEKIRNFKVRDNDVWIISYPKCGTTWTQEMVWLLGNNLDYETGRKVDLSERSPYLELATFVPFVNSLKSLDKVALGQRRFIKTHLSANLLPSQLWRSKALIVYVARNPKDAAISYYHHYNGVNGFKGTFTDYLDGFLDGSLMFGSYYNHVHEFYELSQRCDNIYFNTYEDMKFNLRGVCGQVATFLGKSYTDEQLARLESHLLFDNMKQVKTSNMSLTVKYAGLARGKLKNNFVFMRKGQVGSFKDEMPADYIKRFDEESLVRWNGIHNFHERWLRRDA